MTSRRPLRVGFVMEQVLGHVTVTKNLQAAVEGIVDVEPRWVETSLYREGGIIERVPLLPAYVRGGVRGLIDVTTGQFAKTCDVVIFNTQKAAIFCQPLMLTTPTILMTDVTPIQYDALAAPYGHAAGGAGPVVALKHWTNVLNFRLARAVVGYSRWTLRSCVEDYGVPESRAYVIPPGVDTARWRPRETFRSKGTLRMLFVGGDFERKGGWALLDAYRALGLATLAELHVVTREPVPATHGVIVHRDVPNNSDQILELYRGADLFVLPTTADCFSNASIEAMACGVPVITTPVGGIGDIVVDGECGLLVPPGDGRALATAIRRLITDADLRARLGAAARRRAVTHFDARTNAIRLLDLARMVSRSAAGRRGAEARAA